MRGIIFTLLTIFLVQTITPWWMISIVMGVYGWSVNNHKIALLYGAVIVCLAWGIKLSIGYFMGGSILMERVADMMNFGSSIGLFMVSLILAMILGLLCSLSGYHIRQLYKLFFSTRHSNI